MNKALLIFIFLALLIVSAAIVYKQYCASKTYGCKQEKFEDNDFGPEEGTDW